jgi:hypothetical protein
MCKYTTTRDEGLSRGSYSISGPKARGRVEEMTSFMREVMLLRHTVSLQYWHRDTEEFTYRITRRTSLRPSIVLVVVKVQAGLAGGELVQLSKSAASTTWSGAANLHEEEREQVAKPKSSAIWWGR